MRKQFAPTGGGDPGGTTRAPHVNGYSGTLCANIQACWQKRPRQHRHRPALLLVTHWYAMNK
jgi:hypothetical protein